jgi:anti-sigma regulatory factor (Ser/Thr protein kinase)
MSVTARFGCDPFSVVEARKLVEGAVRPCADDVAADAALLTSELASNVVLHAGTSFEVLVDQVDGHIRVTVVDESPEPPTVQRPEPDAVGGRGLVLVARLSDRWGFEPHGAGKAVWFELDA